MDGALPAHMVDLVTDGVSADDLRRKGHRAVYNALVRTAASAQQRGWSRPRWEDLIEARALGRQNRTDAGGRPSNPKAARKRLWKAWDAAAEWLDDQDAPWSAEAARQRVDDLADTLTTATLDEAIDLSPNERTLLAAVAAIAAKRGSDRLTLPRAVLVEATGLGVTALRTALASLDRRGALTLDQAGTRRSKGKPGRANVYRLGALSQSGNPVSGAPHDLAVPPASVPPALSSAPDQPIREESPMLDVSLRSITPEEEAVMLAALARHRAEQARPSIADVRHLRAVDDQAGAAR